MERTKTVVWNVNHFWDDENGNPTEWVCSNAANEPYLWILKKEGKFEVRDTVNPEFTALKSVSSLEEAMKWAAENNLGIVNKEPYRVAGISGMYFYDRVNSLVICASELGEERRQENDQWIKKYGKSLYDIFTVDGKDYVEWDAIGLNIENWENVELRNEYLYEWQDQHQQEVENLIKQDEKLQAGLNDKLHYMVEGMDKLLGELNKYPNGKTFTVEEIIGISNTLYYEMTKPEEAQIIKAPEILNESVLTDEQQITPLKMTLDEYLGSQGVGFPTSGYMLDKVRFPHGISKSMRRQIDDEFEKVEGEYAERRAQAKKEYEEKVTNGEIIPKTREEITIEKAQGDPLKESTQSARSMIIKRGIMTEEDLNNNILVWDKKWTAQEREVREEVIKAPEILNEYNLVDQLTKFFNSHPEISNQMNISNSDVEDFMDSIYDEDGEFHKDWLKQEVMDAVSEPIDISMELHNVDLSEEQLTYHNMNLQACIDKTDKLSQTIDWLLEKNPEYYKELSNCQATMKYNSEWMKDDMKLLDDRMNRILSENIEKAVDQVIDATEPEVDFGMEM